MILVTTPTGDIGSRVLSHLIAAKAQVRVILRDPSKLPGRYLGEVEVATGSHGDPAAIGSALDGVNTVFWLPPGHPTSAGPLEAYAEFSKGFCAALPSSTVRHVVGVSALGRGWPEPAGLVSASLAMDDMIAATGVHYRALACASLMDNLARQAESIQKTGAFYQPSPGDLALPHVAKADVATTAAHFILDTSWDDAAEIPLLGPQDLTFNEMAGTLSDVLGRDVAFNEMPMDDFAKMLQGLGTTEGMTRGYVEMLSAKNEGMDTLVADADRKMSPTTFRLWCQTELLPILTAES